MSGLSGTVLLLLMGWAHFAWAGPFPAASPASEDGGQLQEKGVEHFYNLEYDQAIAAFEKLRDADPDNPSWQNHVSAAYFYKQLYLAGVLQGDLFASSNKFFRTKKIKVDPHARKTFLGSERSCHPNL